MAGAPNYAIPKRAPADPSPLSYSQQRLWFLDQLSPADPTYNIPYVMNIEGALRADALQNALDAVVARHEVLRTVFRNVDGMPIPVVRENCRVPLRQVDLTEVPQEERMARAQLLVREEASRGFDLARDCMVRGLIIRMDHEKYVFLHNSHHIAWEFRSTALFYSELGSLYEELVSGRPVHLPELPIQYADFALWQRQFLQGEMLERMSEYWKQQLTGSAGDLSLPIDLPRPAVQSRRGRRYPMTLSTELLEAARTLSLKSGVTPFTSLFAAFTVFLHSYSGQEDISVGSPIARRRRDEIEPLIGFFVNTLVLRAQLCGNPTFRDLLGRLSRVILGAIAHADLPFDKLVEILRPPRKSGGMPLFQVNFRVIKEPVPVLRLKGLQVSAPEWVDNETSKFDLSLELVATGGAAGFFEYSTERFSRETIARMAVDFEALLRALVAEPDIPIAQLKKVRDIRARVLAKEVR
ncbi:MAG TPA: condensation domain-containing protein [Terriglobales bacterium]